MSLHWLALTGRAQPNVSRSLQLVAKHRLIRLVREGEKSGRNRSPARCASTWQPAHTRRHHHQQWRHDHRNWSLCNTLALCTPEATQPTESKTVLARDANRALWRLAHKWIGALRYVPAEDLAKLGVWPDGSAICRRAQWRQNNLGSESQQGPANCHAAAGRADATLTRYPRDVSETSRWISRRRSDG